MTSPHTHQVHTFNDGQKLRLLGDAVLVRIDPPPTMSGGGLIHLGNSAEHPYNTGTILAFGTRDLKDGRRVPLSDELEPGMKCMFIRYLAEQDSNKYMRGSLESDVIRIRMSDIILVFPDGEVPAIS